MPTSRRPFRVTLVSLALIALLAVVTSGAGVAATSQSFAVAADSYISADSPTCASTSPG